MVIHEISNFSLSNYYNNNNNNNNNNKVTFGTLNIDYIRNINLCYWE